MKYISSLESEISFLEKEIKGNKMTSSVIPLRSTECINKQPSSVANSLGNKRESNTGTHCSNNGRISYDINSGNIN